MTDRHVTCKACGWVYFGVTREYAENQVKEFNEWFDKQPVNVQSFYGHCGASMDTYLNCWCGNEYKNFRDSKGGDCPDGVTISPILYYSEL